jgi:4-hydroxyphenylpyruvate dioxygenase-like putative hemolysin
MIRENLPLPSNPLGMKGVEFVEYTTREPLALGALLRQMGFHEVARHRSREVILYRQGDMNVIVNGHLDRLPRARRGLRASPGSGAGCVGHGHARGGDGAAHSGHPRRR